MQMTADLYGRLSTHLVNITDKAAIEGLVDEVKAVHGSVDGIINNAGIIAEKLKQ